MRYLQFLIKWDIIWETSWSGDGALEAVIEKDSAAHLLIMLVLISTVSLRSAVWAVTQLIYPREIPVILFLCNSVGLFVKWLLAEERK